MKAAMGTVNESLERVTELITKSPQTSGTQFSVLEMCRDVLRESVAQLNTSLCRVHAAAAAAALNNKKQLKSSNVVTDIQHYASAALTYHSTCITGIAEYGVWDGSTDLLPNSSFRVHRSIQLLSNALALVNGIVTESSDSVPSSSSSHNRRKLLVTSPSASSSSSLQHLHLHRQRRNAHVDDGYVDQELLGYFPSWLSKRDRRLLQATTTTAPNANAIVALDGSGEYTSVQAAVDAAPSKSSSRWVIYIKGGVYNENVNIAAGQTNLMFVGDGAGVTILTGSKSVAGSQVTTYYTATLGQQQQTLNSSFLSPSLALLLSSVCVCVCVCVCVSHPCLNVFASARVRFMGALQIFVEELISCLLLCVRWIWICGCSANLYGRINLGYSSSPLLDLDSWVLLKSLWKNQLPVFFFASTGS
jgi:hypothetical protein